MANRLYDSLYREAQAALAKTLQGEERRIIRYYGTALAECRKKLEAIYRKYGKDGRLTNADMSKYNRLSTLQDDICTILEEQLVNVDAMTKRLTGEQYQEAFYRHAYAIDQAGGMGLSWGQIPKDAVRAAVESPLSKLAGSRAMAMSRKGTVDKVRDELALAVIRGDSYEKLAMRISDVLGVRVEDGNRTRYLDKGAAYRSMDEEHGGWFVPSIGWVSGPLHSGVARFDINCRCRVVSEIRGLPPEERHTRGDGVRPYCTYEQWKANNKIGDVHIGRSVGAAAKNYPVLISGNEHGRLKEGTSITKIKLIAGKGHKNEIRNRFRLESDYHIPADKWQKMRGDGYVEHKGSVIHAELHWYEADDERVEMKVKRTFNDEGEI